MEEIKQQIEDLYKQVEEAIQILNLSDKIKNLEDLKIRMAAPDFWEDNETAISISTKASDLEGQINAWQSLKDKLDTLNSLAADKEASDVLEDLQRDFQILEKRFNELSDDVYFDDVYDNRAAIVSINSGAGGVDAQDWAQILERMYLRFAEKNNWSVVILSRSSGAEAGIKNTTFKINGQHVYGYMKNEAGVHRLVRLSPFDADNARHTSFAMVDVFPEVEDSQVEIKDDDLKIDTFRASGHGGQSVNTTDSAVRITHLPTGIIASCQNERSQLQNKKQALSYLKSKLEKYYQAEAEEEKRAIKGEYTEAAWGNQIRSYVMQPYKMVKDHRTKYESSNIDKVLDGDLMAFIKANLKKELSKN